MKTLHKKVLRRRPRMRHKKKGGLRYVDYADDIKKVVLQEKHVQDVLGLTDDDMSRMYENAANLMQQHHYDAAVEAFRLLTQVNPYMYEFQLGLGSAFQLQGEYQKALAQYMLAEVMEPLRPEVYHCAIELFIELGLFSEAKNMLRRARAYVHDHPKEETVRDLRKTLSALAKQVHISES